MYSATNEISLDTSIPILCEKKQDIQRAYGAIAPTIYHMKRNVLLPQVHYIPVYLCEAYFLVVKKVDKNAIF